MDRHKLESLLSTLICNVNSIGQIGHDWDRLCVSLNDSLAESLEKTGTMTKKVKRLQKEKSMSITRQKS